MVPRRLETPLQGWLGFFLLPRGGAVRTGSLNPLFREGDSSSGDRRGATLFTCREVLQDPGKASRSVPHCTCSLLSMQVKHKVTPRPVRCSPSGRCHAPGNNF